MRPGPYRVDVRHALTPLLIWIAVQVAGCTWAPQDVHGSPCAVEASYECQMYRYSHAP